MTRPRTLPKKPLAPEALDLFDIVSVTEADVELGDEVFRLRFEISRARKERRQYRANVLRAELERGCMASGERSQTWFPELIADLRRSWRADLSWETVIQVRDELQASLEQILESRGIRPALVRCSHCGHVGPGAPPRISVRALLLALRRFDIEPDHRVSVLEKAWAHYRKVQQVDAYGKQTHADGHAAHAHPEARA